MSDSFQAQEKRWGWGSLMVLSGTVDTPVFARMA